MIGMTVCSGIGAPEHSAPWIDWQFQSEIEKFPSAVLAERFPHARNLGDMTKYKEWPDANVDVLCGGTPCQSFSVAGLRAGLDDPRGQLMLTYLAIAARYRPRWVVWENVPGALSADEGRALAAFLKGLELLGYHAAWRVLDVQFGQTLRFPWAIPQRRNRLFVVGYLGDWRRAAAVLLEPESLSRNPAPRREAGQVAAGTLNARTQGGGGLGTDFELGGGLVANSGDVSMCLTASAQGSLDAETETLIAFDTTQVTSKSNYSNPKPGDPCHPLAAGAHPPAIAIQERAVSENPNAGPDGAGVNAEGAAYTLEARNKVQAVAFAQNTRDEVRLLGGDGQIAGALAADAGMKQTTYLAEPWAVRRLTPRECERLMGFPDVTEKVILSVWQADRCPLPAPAEALCTTGQSNASSAAAGSLKQNARSADQNSSTSPLGHAPAVALRVLLNSAQGVVEIHNAERCLWSAKNAEKQSASPLFMPVEDFAHLVAGTTQMSVRQTPVGRVVLPRNTEPSTHRANGERYVNLSGQEIRDHADDVEKLLQRGPRHFTSTTLPSIANIPISASTLTTLCCCVLRATDTFTQPLMQSGNSFSLSIEHTSGWTQIAWRGKAPSDCPDGPRYKALGNSWGVNCGEYIFDRIKLVEGEGNYREAEG